MAYSGQDDAFDQAWDSLMQSFDVSPENNPAMSGRTTGPSSVGNLHHVTSSDTHHYFVHSDFNALNNWFMPIGVKSRVLRIPHEDWERMENDDYPMDVISPTESRPRPYNTGQGPANWTLDPDHDHEDPLKTWREHMQEAIEYAFIEQAIDADPAAFGYDE